MVVKNIVRYIINRYLKNYIEELDDDKLNFHLINGYVSLEDLHLKAEALADLSLPVSVAAGYLEKLRLTLPWRRLTTDPTKVHIDGLYLLIVPKNEHVQDLDEYQANKMRRVQRKVDDLRTAMLENKKLEEKDTTFFERTRLQIMQNIEVTLENIHISYETKSTTKLGHAFSFGCTLRYLKLTTTTDHSAKKRAIEVTPIIYMIKEINSLSFYWNTKCESRTNMPFNVVIEDLKSKIATNGSRIICKDMNYILYPITFDVDVTITVTPGEHKFDRATFNIMFFVEHLTLNIDSKQFSDLLDFFKFQNYSTLYERCREYRELYLQETIDSTQLTQLHQDRLKVLESKLDVFNLSYIRHSIEIEIQNRTRINSSDENVSGKHHHQRWNWWSKKKHKHNHDEQRMSTTTTTTTMEEPNHNDGFSFYFDDIPNILIDIRTKKLDLNLVSSLPITTASSRGIYNRENREIITHVTVVDCKIDIIKRSVSSSLLAVLNIGSLRLYGIGGNEFKSPLLLKPISQCSSPMMHIEFELFPINTSKSDYRFLWSVQPIEIIYNAEMFNRIVQDFEPNVNPNPSSSTQIKKRKPSQMEDDLSSRQTFDMTIEFKHVSLTFPKDGVYKENNSMINIHFDQFVLKSCLEENEIDDQNGKRFYVKYQLKANDLGIVVSYSDGSRLNFFRKIPLVDIRFFKCIYSDDADLHDWLINLIISHIEHTRISKTTLAKFISHFQSIPQFYSTIVQIICRINYYFELFQSHTSLQANIAIDQTSFIIQKKPTTLVKTNLKCFISKERNQFDRLTLVLENLVMTMKKSYYPFYSNRYLQLNYTPNSHRF